MTPLEKGTPPWLGNRDDSSLRRKGWLVVAVLAVVLGLAAMFLWTPSEPSFKGKSLSHWLEAYQIPFMTTNGLWRNGKPIGADDETPTRYEADAAFEAIGTNAIPTLLRLIQHRDSRRGYWQFSLAHKAPFFRIVRISAHSPNNEALMAFRALGTNAGPAVPQLMEIYKRESDRDTKDWVLPTLIQIGPPAEAAVPMLLRILAETNIWLRENAVQALAAIHADAPVVVPALIPCLRDPDAMIRLAAVIGIGRYGKAAKSAAPALLELLRDPKLSAGPFYTFTTPSGAPALVHAATIAETATNALRDIDPETARKAGIWDDW
jgi:HEAT repeat protein